MASNKSPEAFEEGFVLVSIVVVVVVFVVVVVVVVVIVVVIVSVDNGFSLSGKCTDSLGLRI